MAARTSGLSVRSTSDEISRLRARMQRLEGTADGLPREALPTHPALTDLVQLYAGSTYQVDGATLAMAMLAGPSQAGGWGAVVGVTDFGAEAAAELGIDLSRTALVPEPGDQWLDVTAALIDVASVVVVRPPVRVEAPVAQKIAARLRKRSTALVVWGPWPRCEVRLSVQEPQWSGVGQGHGHLRSRRLVVEARRGATPPRRATLWLPADDATYRREGQSVSVPASVPATVPASVAEIRSAS